jgi:ABC-type transporter Mla subunit MlaD
MRRALALILVLGSASALAVLGTGADDGDGEYTVRAIFQNAFSLVPGEDVKMAGVKVGKIESLDVTPEQQAAVVFKITRAGFDDFRADAECTVRPQSLIGEKFVECTPTQPRPAGAPLPPPLKEIPEGEDGAGQHLITVEHTSRPVDIDLVNNVLRLPYRQRLGIIINEFGTGLAGRGEDLNDVIRNADPALKATDKVLKLLASQNKVLADLAEQSDIALAPLAREKRSLQDAIVQSADLATATAERQTPFGQQFEKLPVFLREQRPTLERLGEFADEATPVLSDLRSVAPEVGRLIKASGPFATSGTKALVSLGKATVPGRKALLAAEDIVDDLGAFTKTGKPLAKGLKDILVSFKATGGVERLLDYIFYQVSAINGFDQFGHYLRASLLVNLCSTYATERDIACSANFLDLSKRRSAPATKTALEALHQPGVSLANRRTAAVLRGMTPQEAIRLTSGESDPTVVAASTEAQPAAVPTAAESADIERNQQVLSQLSQTESGGDAGAQQKLLDYLLGGGK